MKKLTQDNRADINRRLRAGDRQKDIADDFGVSQSTINRVRSQAKKAERDVIGDDPFPALSDASLRKRYWSKVERLTIVLNSRTAHLNKSRSHLENEIYNCSREAREASTAKMQESYLRRAESYRLELIALDDLSDFDTELNELFKNLYTLSSVLVKIRKIGLGKP